MDAWFPAIINDDTFMGKTGYRGPVRQEDAVYLFKEAYKIQLSLERITGILKQERWDAWASGDFQRSEGIRKKFLDQIWQRGFFSAGLGKNVESI